MIYYRFCRVLLYLGILLQAISDKEYWLTIIPALLMLVEITDYIVVNELKNK